MLTGQNLDARKSNAKFLDRRFRLAPQLIHTAGSFGLIAVFLLAGVFQRVQAQIPTAVGWTPLPASTSLQESGACPPNNFGGDAFLFTEMCANVIRTWNGAIADTNANRLIIWGGGHNNYYGNEIYSLNLTANPITLTRVKDPTVPTNFNNSQTCVESIPPGSTGFAPNSREDYGGLAFIPTADVMYILNGSAACLEGDGSLGTWTISLNNISSSTSWLFMNPTMIGPQPGVFPGLGGSSYGNIAVYDPNSGLVFVSDSSALFTYNYQANTTMRVTPIFGFTTSIYLSGAIDPVRKLFVAVGGCAGGTCGPGDGVFVADISNPASTTMQNWTSATMADPNCLQFLAGGANPISASNPGIVYDPVANDFVGWPNQGNSVYIMTPDTVNQRLTCQVMTFPNGPPNSAHSNNTPNTSLGTFGRFQYFSAFDAFVLVNDWNIPPYILRLRSGSGFTLAATPSTASVNPGSSANYTVNVNAAGSFAGTVGLSGSGLPAGASASFNPTTITTSGSSTLTVNVPAGSSGSHSTLTISGTSGSATETASVTLNVTVPTFTLTATPSVASASPGNNASYTVNVNAVNGFTGTVNLGVSGLPSGATTSFNPTSITNSGTSTLTVSIPAGSSASSSSLTISGTSGAITQTANVTLNVTVPDFMLTATPGSETVSPGGSTTYTINTSALNGFTGTVNLSVSGQPSGTTVSFSSNSVTVGASSTLTVNTTSGALTGTSTLTITGTSTSGSLTHSATVALVVNTVSSTAGVISIDLVGSNTTPMGSSEQAGVVTVSNWNDAKGAKSSSPLALVDQNGNATTATVTWTSDDVWDASGVSDQAGNNRMMRGYLDNGNEDTSVVTVNGLPSNASGFNIYVYAQGDGGSGATNTGIYQISGTGITTSSTALTYNSNFNGTFTQATASNANGNYVVFAIPNVSGFTLSAIPSTASNGFERAPVNGMQIVPVQATSGFTLAATPGSAAVNPGNSASYTVNVGAVGSFSGTVGLSVSGLPSGATASFSPTSINTSGSATLTVNIPSGSTASSSSLTISGTSGSVTQTANVSLNVIVPDFTISATPGNANVTPGGTATYTVNTGILNGFTGTVNLAASGQPSGATVAFNPTSVTAGSSATLTVTTSSATPSGSSTITITGTSASGSPSHTTTVTLAVSSAPVITSATTASGVVGTAFSYQITATNAPTSFGATGLPSGLSLNSGTGLVSGTPTATGTSTVTLSATNASGTGTATLKLAITSSSVSFVQEAASSTPGTASSLAVFFPGNTGTGDLILVAFDFDTNATAASVTDTQGNTYTQIGNQLTSPGGARSVVFYAKNIKGGADSVTVTLSANSSFLEVYLTDYSGVNQTSPIDSQAGASGQAGPVSSGNALTTAGGDLIFGYCLADAACTAGSGFTARSIFHGNLIEDSTAGSPASYAATGSANGGWNMQMVAIKHQ